MIGAIETTERVVILYEAVFKRRFLVSFIKSINGKNLEFRSSRSVVSIFYIYENSGFIPCFDHLAADSFRIGGKVILFSAE